MSSELTQTQAKAPAEARLVCSSQNQKVSLWWVSLHWKTLCSQPCDAPGRQAGATRQCLPLMASFNHAARPERAHAEVGNGPLSPWLHRQIRQQLTALPRSCGDCTAVLSLHIWPEEGAACNCLARESALFLQGKQHKITDTCLASPAQTANVCQKTPQPMET